MSQNSWCPHAGLFLCARGESLPAMGNELINQRRMGGLAQGSSRHLTCSYMKEAKPNCASLPSVSWQQFQLSDRRVPASTSSSLPSNTSILRTRRCRGCCIFGGLSCFSGLRLGTVVLVLLTSTLQGLHRGGFFRMLRAINISCFPGTVEQVK